MSVVSDRLGIQITGLLLGRYIRYALVEKVSQETQHPTPELIFGWEIAHRSDSRRQSRKIVQLMIDEMTFVISGLLALIFFKVLLPLTTIFCRMPSPKQFPTASMVQRQQEA